MSIAEHRGGIPVVDTVTFDTTGREYTFLKQATKYLQIRAASNPAIVYFTAADFAAGTNGLTIPVAAAATPWGWEGPAEVKNLWIKGSGGNSDVTIIAFLRRS